MSAEAGRRTQGPTDGEDPGHDADVDTALPLPSAYASEEALHASLSDDRVDASGAQRLGRTEGERGRPKSLAFEAVYDEWFDFVWRSARRLGVHESSLDDVAQDVFVVVYRRLAEFEGRSTLKTWLFGITLRVVSDWRRTKRRKGGLSELPSEEVLASPGASPSSELERRQGARLLSGLLEQLDDEKREVFVMIELEEMSAPEVAQLLEIPLNTVYSRLRVAREDFERSLTRHRARERGAGERARAEHAQKATPQKDGARPRRQSS